MDEEKKDDRTLIFKLKIVVVALLVVILDLISINMEFRSSFEKESKEKLELAKKCK